MGKILTNHILGFVFIRQHLKTFSPNQNASKVPPPIRDILPTNQRRDIMRGDVDGDIAQSLVNAMRSVGANLAVILNVLTHL